MNLADYYNNVIELSHGIVLTLDDKGLVVHGNSRFERISEFQISQIAGQDWFGMFVEEKRREQAKAVFEEVLGSGRRAFLKGSIRTASGRKVYIDWNLKPLFDSRQQPICVLCVGVDVTAHIERQRNLLDEQTRLVVVNKELTCLHSMNRIISDTDKPLPEILEEIISIIPPAFQYPECTGVLLSLDGRELMSGVFVPDAEQRIDEAVFVQKVKRGKLRVSLTGLTDRGEEQIFLDTEHDLLAALAKHVGWIIAKREALDTRRNLERQLQHADRLAKIGQFAAGVAHELNEPLANILGFAQLAASSPDLSGQVCKDLDNIVKSALHSREIIKKLMIFSRQVPLQKALSDLNQIIRDALYFTESSALRSQVCIELDLEEGLPQIFADPQHLKQVMVNLVVNAIHAMSGGGTLSIATHSFKNDVYLIVSDTGVGMSAEIRRQIFNPFFTTKDVDQGTGLGLAVVHGIIQAHGGVIEVESAPGRGSRFEITFPCAESAPAQ